LILHPENNGLIGRYFLSVKTGVSQTPHVSISIYHQIAVALAFGIIPIEQRD
jgi:hypothetical protein